MITAADWRRLQQHHYRGDGDERGSVLLCGVLETERERRLLVREVLEAVDGRDYIAGPSGHSLVASFVVRAISRAADENLAYLAVHNHWPGTSVRFSPIDLASHERGYPALLDIARGGPVGALVLGGEAVAGDIWTPAGRSSVEKVIVIGANRKVLFPSPPIDDDVWQAHDDRQARIFGASGQRLLAALKVGVVGLGGAGSMVVQALAHLGVGELVLVDDDLVEKVNLRRIVGSVSSDAEHPPAKGAPKVAVATRLAMSINPAIEVRPYQASVVKEHAAFALRDLDALFIAADSAQARHVSNAICHQYMVPGFQMGARVSLDRDGTVQDAFALSRMVFPGAVCNWCSGLISREKLQKEALSPEERKAVSYVDDVPDPSVITMNMMSTAIALNDFLFMFTGLHTTDDLGPRRYHFPTREPVVEEGGINDCRWCRGRKAKGDRDDLPTAEPAAG